MGEVVRPLSPDPGDRGRRALKVLPRAKLSLTPESKAHLPIHPTPQSLRGTTRANLSLHCVPSPFMSVT
ncbi:hypothetical protein ACRRTK_011509 [Alexandromys fortis]